LRGNKTWKGAKTEGAKSESTVKNSENALRQEKNILIRSKEKEESTEATEFPKMKCHDEVRVEFHLT